MTKIQETLRELAAFDPADLPVLSVYLDLRPGATGARPTTRPADTVLKDRLREIERTLLPRGPGLDSVRADIKKITEFIETGPEGDASGVAIFACDGAGLFKTVSTGANFTNQVTADAHPDIFQLVRLLDDFETAIVAVADTRALRVFVVSTGALHEVSGLDDADDINLQRRTTGGWNKARYQRHVDRHRADFAGDAARQIEHLIESEGATRLVLAGNAIVMPLLLQALSPASLALLAGEPLHIDMRAQRDDIAEEVQAVLRAAEKEDEIHLVDALFEAIQRGGLAVIGEAAAADAISRGQVHVLFLDPNVGTEETRAELTRSAIATGADVEVVEEDERLREVDGIAATLRWPLDLGTTSA